MVLFLFNANGQWSPGEQPGNTFHLGTVQIGTKDVVKAKLQVHRIQPAELEPGYKPLPLLRLSTFNELKSKTTNWDIDGSSRLSFSKNGSDILDLTNWGAKIHGYKLILATAGKTPIIRLENKEKSNWEIYSEGGLRFRGGSGSNLTDRLVIAEDGRVMINVDPSANFPDVTSSTQDYKMFVNGGVACKEVKVRTDWADYVFDKDYEVLPLHQVAQYIDTNHHLPNMPSAQKIQQEGVELGDITTKQQEKIEVLFLHLIELEKRITELEKENQLLKSKK